MIAKVSLRISIFLFLLINLLGGCSSSPRQEASKQWMREDGRLKVLSTTAMAGDLVNQIGGPYVSNFVLIGDELDPHSYQLVKGDDEKLARADLIFYNGLNLEHGPSLQAALINNPKANALGDAIIKAHPEKLLRVGEQKDPHIWMDISLWAEAIPSIVEALSKADPQHAKEFADKGKTLHDEMLHVHDLVYSQLQAIPSRKRYIVTSHDAFNYFTRAYLAEKNELASGIWQERFAAPEGLAPDSQLSTSHIQAIMEHLDKYHITVLFPESNVSKDSIKKILSAGQEIGLPLAIASEALYGDAMGPPGSDGDTYLKMILHNAHILIRYLSQNGKENRQAALNRLD